MRISTLTSAEGRFNVFISDNGVIAIVDYAHTPMHFKMC